MVEWLGTLLDNAIEATSTIPIYIFVDVGYDYIDIRMSNEYFGNDGQDIRAILENGYSSKGDGRGIGLHDLNQQVVELGSTIELEEYSNEAHNCHYLKISMYID